MCHLINGQQHKWNILYEMHEASASLYNTTICLLATICSIIKSNAVGVTFRSVKNTENC